jgi:hypothetical protein
MGFALGPMAAIDLFDGRRGHVLVVGYTNDGLLVVLNEVGNLEYRMLDQVTIEIHYDDQYGIWRDDNEEPYATEETHWDQAIPGQDRDPEGTGDGTEADGDPGDLDPEQGPDQG